MLSANSIAPSHRQEWLDSRVSEEIIARNVCSFTDPQELDKYLNRNTNSRWKHSRDLVPGWGVSGVDPRTGERDFSSFQYKSDTQSDLADGSVFSGSRGGLTGKRPKYLSPSGATPVPLFLDTGKEGYWPNVLKDPSQPIYIVEGAKKAGCLLSLGLPAIAITGCYNGAPDRRLSDLIALFCQGQRRVFLVPDGDWRDNFHVGNGWGRLGQLIEKKKCSVFVVVWDEAHKGIDDYAASGGDILQVVSESIPFKDWRNELKAIHKEANAGYPVLTQERVVPLLEKKMGERLRLNVLTQAIEIDGFPLDTDIAYLAIGGEFGYRINKELCNDALHLVAKRNEYNPVAEYLEGLQEPKRRVDINKLATCYLGTSDPLYDTFVKKFLIGAVARALQPGCKVDTALILQGPQGIGKSSFFRILGGPWFDDSMGPLEGKDDVMTLHRAWIHEWGELEFLTGKKHSSEIKQFLSRAIDRFRPPYGRYVKEFPRRSVICGTTNQQDFLRDETGNRRFWVIPVAKGGIALDALKRDRDAIWYEAVSAYKRGEIWWLSPEEAEQSESRNQGYLPEDPWEAIILARLQDQKVSGFSTTEVLTEWLQIEGPRQNKQDTNRVGAILRKQGYELKKRTISGVQKKVWEKVSEKIGTLGTEELESRQGKGLTPVPNSYSTGTQPPELSTETQDVGTQPPELSTHLGGDGYHLSTGQDPYGTRVSPTSSAPGTQGTHLFQEKRKTEKNSDSPPPDQQDGAKGSITPPPPSLNGNGRGHPPSAPYKPGSVQIGDKIRVKPESPSYQICLDKELSVVKIEADGVVVRHQRWIEQQRPLILWEHIDCVVSRAREEKGTSPGRAAFPDGADSLAPVAEPIHSNGKGED